MERPLSKSNHSNPADHGTAKWLSNAMRQSERSNCWAA
jgi:hypothetical protein